MEFEFHDDTFFILPLLLLQSGDCEDPQCEKSHYRLCVGWLFWSVNLILS
jgi:hypothetical protein